MNIPPRPSADGERLERTARLLCRADEGLDPDRLVYPGVPYQVRGGYVTATDPHPAWVSYLRMAMAALDADWLEARRVERGE